MGVEGDLSHEGWAQTIADVGYPAAAIGETILFGTDSPAVAVNVFYNSQLHREIMLNPVYRSLGAGCVKDENGVPWVSFLFGSR